MSVTSYRDLIAWQKAMDLVLACYRYAESFPNAEAFGLTSQLRRAAVSVPANIAEGHSRRRSREYLHHLDIAYGSLGEAETHICIAMRLGYGDCAEATSLLAQSAEVGRILNGLIDAIAAKTES